MVRKSSPNNEPKGTSLGVAFFLILGFALAVILGLGAALYFMRGENRKFQEKLDAVELKEKEHELEQKAGAEKYRLDRALARQQEVLRQARAATNALMNLLAEVNAVTAEATALKTNTDGQTVSSHPDLLAQARSFYDGPWREVPVAADVITRLEGARRIEQQMLSQQGTAYEPPGEILSGAANAAVSAEQDRGKIKQIRDYLSSLVRESKVKYTQATLTTNSPHLEDAIKTSGDAETAERRRKLAEQTAAANLEADRIRAEEKAKGIIADAEREAAKIRAEAEESKAALEREMAIKKAKAQTEEVRKNVTIATEADEARKVELRKKAADPQIQAKLAPFTTPGYVGIYKPTIERKPFSFSEMQSLGALAPTIEGMDRLVAIGVAPNDKIRPHWKINQKLYRRHTDEFEMVKETQALLIELGPVLVEMGQLLP